MAIFLCFFWLTLLYADSYIQSKEKDIFSPLRFVTLRLMLQQLPFILYIAIFPDNFFRKILSVCKVDVQSAFLQFTFVQTVAYLSLVAGINFIKKDFTFLKRYISNHGASSLRKMRTAYLLLFTVAVLACIACIINVGGLGYLLSHLTDKSRTLLRVNQYYAFLFVFLYISPLICMQAISRYGRGADKLMLFLQIAVALFLENTLGGRTGTVILLATIVAGYHYIIKPIKFNWSLLAKIVPLGVVFSMYFLAVPLLRSGNHLSDFKRFASIRNFMYQTSYVYIDVFSSNYFTFDNAWWFSGFFEPVKALGAKKEKKGDIPQVDQGVYFKSIVLRQQYYKPPMPRKDLVLTSWPTENFGFAYANFLLPGTIIFFFLLGVLFSWGYKIMRGCIDNPAVISFYIIFILLFNFSSLRVADFVKITWLYLLIAVVYHKFIHKKMTEK